MKLKWFDIPPDKRRSWFQSSEKYVSDEIMLFSDEFVEWIETYAPSARFAEYIYDDKIIRSRILSSMTEGHWKFPMIGNPHIVMDDEEYLLFKLTWL